MGLLKWFVFFFRGYSHVWDKGCLSIGLQMANIGILHKRYGAFDNGGIEIALPLNSFHFELHSLS